jgi:hypothetical protein
MCGLYSLFVSMNEFPLSLCLNLSDNTVLSIVDFSVNVNLIMNPQSCNKKTNSDYTNGVGRVYANILLNITSNLINPLNQNNILQEPLTKSNAQEEIHSIGTENQDSKAADD